MHIPLDVTQPPPRPQTLEQAQALIDVLWDTLRQMQTRLLELEEQVRLTSRNSSKPPSSDGPARERRYPERPKSGRRGGGQPGHPGVTRALVPLPEVDQVYPCWPVAQCPCGGEIRVMDAPCERHQVFELPAIRPHVTEYQRYAGVCTGCGHRWEGTLPAGVPRGQFGPGVLALIALLAGAYHLSTRQIHRLFQEVFHLDIGVGTVSQAQASVSAALAAVVTDAQGAVRQASVVNVDETGHRQGRKRQWLWVAVSATQSVFRIDPHRNQAAAQALLGADFAGTVGSDRYSAYGWVAPTHRQLCWAHLLRDFQRMAERSGPAGDIGTELLAYGRALFALWHRWHEGLLAREQFEQFMDLLRQVVKLTLTAGAHCGHPATEHTCEHLLELEEALWTFVKTPGVEPTNNTAERALRGYVIWRKLSFGTQSTRGNRFIERLSTVVATCRQHGRAVLAYLREAIEAFLCGRSAPPLVPVPDS